MVSKRGQAVLISLQQLRTGRFAGLSGGALAQLGERLICIQEVIGSIPIGSTNPPWRTAPGARDGPVREPEQVGSVAQVVRAHA